MTVPVEAPSRAFVTDRAESGERGFLSGNEDDGLLPHPQDGSSAPPAPASLRKIPAQMRAACQAVGNAFAFLRPDRGASAADEEIRISDSTRTSEAVGR
jgi:hypothetical protein